jgi:Fic family protein
VAPPLPEGDLHGFMRPEVKLDRRLVCPSIDLSDLTGPICSLDYGTLAQVAERYSTATSTFGLELRVSYAIEAGGNQDERVRRPYFRPAQEPIIWSWWDKLQQGPFDPSDILELASLLAGKMVGYRSREMVSFHGLGRHHLFYEAPARSRSWIADIAATDRMPGDPVKKALYRFARIVTAHPLGDANGRLARAVLHGGLAGGGLIATPCLALAPVFALHAAEVRAALAGLNKSRNWQAYFEQMGATLADAVQWVAEA